MLIRVCGVQTIATACLFLAGKVEETPKPLKEIVRVSYLVQHNTECQWAVEQTVHKICSKFVARVVSPQFVKFSVALPGGTTRKDSSSREDSSSHPWV